MYFLIFILFIRLSISIRLIKIEQCRQTGMVLYNAIRRVQSYAQTRGNRQQKM